jgi:hypothetical protein
VLIGSYWRPSKSLLQRIPSEQDRAEVILKALASSKGIFIPIELTQSAAAAASEGRPILSADAMDRLRREIVEKLRSRDPRELQDAPGLGYLLGRWRDWTGVEGPRAAAQAIVTTPTGALRLCRAFSSRGISSESNEDGHIFYRLEVSALEEVVSLDTVRDQLRLLKQTELSDDDRLVLKSAKRGLRILDA